MSLLFNKSEENYKAEENEVLLDRAGYSYWVNRAIKQQEADKVKPKQSQSDPTVFVLVSKSMSTLL